MARRTVKLALDFSSPVIQVELPFSFSFAWGERRLAVWTRLVTVMCCSLESTLATLHLHANT